MPDYAACSQEECPVKNKCARYLMVWGGRQCVIRPSEFAEEGCDLFWDSGDAPFALRKPEEGDNSE